MQFWSVSLLVGPDNKKKQNFSSVIASSCFENMCGENSYRNVHDIDGKKAKIIIFSVLQNITGWVG